MVGTMRYGNNSLYRDINYDIRAACLNANEQVATTLY